MNFRILTFDLLLAELAKVYLDAKGASSCLEGLFDIFSTLSVERRCNILVLEVQILILVHRMFKPDLVVGEQRRTLVC